MSRRLVSCSLELGQELIFVFVYSRSWLLFIVLRSLATFHVGCVAVGAKPLINLFFGGHVSLPVDLIF